jgi:DNA-binding transcriptional ArsR family regulator
MSDQPAGRAAGPDPERVLDALGVPARRRILEVLADGPIPVGVLAQRLPAGRPGISKHLRVLSDAGLVQRRSIGTRNLYALAPDGLAPLQTWLTGTWDVALSAYADRVATTTAGTTRTARKPTRSRSRRTAS